MIDRDAAVVFVHGSGYPLGVGRSPFFTTSPTLTEAFIREQGAANVTFQVADAEALPFPDADFEIVTTRIAPHHFPNPQQYVREVARVLKPSGLFMLDDKVRAVEDRLGGDI